MSMMMMGLVFSYGEENDSDDNVNGDDGDVDVIDDEKKDLP